MPRLIRTPCAVPIALFVAAASSCTAVHTYPADVTHLWPDEQRAALESLVCNLSHQLWTADRKPVGYKSASAVILDRDLLLTARHCVSDALSMEIDGVSLATPPEVYANVDGMRVRYRVVAAGEDAQPVDATDWAMIRIVYQEEGGRELTVNTDAEFGVNREIEVGTEIFLVGYANVDTSSVNAPDAPLPATIIRGRVTKRPAFFPKIDEIILVEVPGKPRLKGMSGGAAVIWDTERDRPIVIGIYRGVADSELLGMTWRRLHEVVRLPKEIFDAD